MGYFSPEHYKTSTCTMCFVYLAPENTSLRLNRNMTRGSHHEPFKLVEAATDAIVAPDIDNETAVNVGMYMYYSWTRTRIYMSVADPGFDLREGVWTLTLGLKSFLSWFGHISIKIMLKINRERSERRKK